MNLPKSCCCPISLTRNSGLKTATVYRKDTGAVLTTMDGFEHVVGGNYPFSFVGNDTLATTNVGGIRHHGGRMCGNLYAHACTGNNLDEKATLAVSLWDSEKFFTRIGAYQHEYRADIQQLSMGNTGQAQAWTDGDYVWAVFLQDRYCGLICWDVPTGEQLGYVEDDIDEIRWWWCASHMKAGNVGKMQLGPIGEFDEFCIQVVGGGARDPGVSTQVFESNGIYFYRGGAAAKFYTVPTSDITDFTEQGTVGGGDYGNGIVCGFNGQEVLVTGSAASGLFAGYQLDGGDWNWRADPGELLQDPIAQYASLGGNYYVAADEFPSGDAKIVKFVPGEEEANVASSWIIDDPGRFLGVPSSNRVDPYDVPMGSPPLTGTQSFSYRAILRDVEDLDVYLYVPGGNSLYKIDDSDGSEAWAIEEFADLTTAYQLDQTEDYVIGAHRRGRT